MTSTLRQVHQRIPFALLDRVDAVVTVWRDREVTTIYRGAIVAAILEGTHTLKSFERKLRIKIPKRERTGSSTVHISLPVKLVARVDAVVAGYELPTTRTAVINAILEGSLTLSDLEAQQKAAKAKAKRKTGS